MPRVPSANSTISPAWHIVEAVDAGDAVADRQHLADLGDFRLLAEILDLLLEDRGDLGGADIHQPTSFMASFETVELGAQRVVDHAAADLDDEAAEEGGIDLLVELHVLAERGLERGLQRAHLAFGELAAREVTSARCLAAMAREQRAEGLDHVGGGEQAAVPGDELEEIRGQPLDLASCRGWRRWRAPAPRRRTPGSSPGGANPRRRRAPDAKRFRSCSTVSSAFSSSASSNRAVA